MKATTTSALFAALLTAQFVEAVPPKRDVDLRFPYTGPAVPIADWVDQSINGNGKGFPRLVEAPAVKPARGTKATNNINVISLSYIPKGINIHFQTPFGLGEEPKIHFGEKSNDLCNKVSGSTRTYARTPSCSKVVVTQCSEFFHDVQISDLKAGTTYFYQIQAANGTTLSEVLSFKTAPSAGTKTSFTIAVINDMGYTNAHGTHRELLKEVDNGLAFAWHGGDISYADDWYSGVLPCASDWPVCYNGSSTALPGDGPIPKEYDVPLPKGEIANQGGPQGGDMNVIYESNWDLWQQWMLPISSVVPYMVIPGNHEASCAEFDGPGNILTALLNDDKLNATAPEDTLSYYSCPPSQRNFTAYSNRFRMPGEESGGVSNFWYSFDYGMAHFVSLDGETDFPFSPEWPFLRDIAGKNETFPTEAQTFVTDSGPFGAINGSITENESYEQYNWLVKDLASVDRAKTPWIIAMSHRPMYSSQVATYQEDLRDAFQELLLGAGVDLYLSGHIHWYERLFPLTATGAIDHSAIINNNTYLVNEGTSMVHIVNGQAGNVESHSTLGTSPLLPITAVLDDAHYGFSKLTFHNATALTWSFILGNGNGIGDELTVLRKASA